MQYYFMTYLSMETLSLAQYVMINWTYGETLGKTV